MYGSSVQLLKVGHSLLRICSVGKFACLIRSRSWSSLSLVTSLNCNYNIVC